MSAARYPLLAMAALGVACALPARATDAAAQPQTHVCGDHVQRLRGADLAHELTGKDIRFAHQAGVCGASWISSPWVLHLYPDGTFVHDLDRGLHQGGHYDFEDDQLCLIAARRTCASFYRDDNGRIYMGPPLGFMGLSMASVG